MRHSAALLICLLGGAAAHSQTLAQKNWAGSGVSAEPWWRRAVFYRIDPATFQDSNNDGKGDLAGIAQRLDYLQSLGVDAVILDASATLDDGNGMPANDGFDDLTRAAVSHHLRVLVTLGVPASQAPAADAQYLALARSWLNQGAAGLYLPTRALQQVDGTTHIGVLLHQLRQLTNSFPGGRVLIAGAPATADTDLARSLLKETHLTASAAITTQTPTAASLRTQLEAALAGPPGAPASTSRNASASLNPMLTAARPAPQKDATTQDALDRTLAAMLLASRSAVILDYGQELGLLLAAKPVVMQWTPSNVTAKPPPPLKPDDTPAPPKPAFQSFREYIPPPRKDLLPPPRMPYVIESDYPQPVITDLNLLPGFTGGALDTSLSAGNGATANVAAEQADPKSLLSFYRQLIQLHHDNAAVRNGSQTMLNADAQDALVWQRHAPAGAHSSAAVVVTCRLGASVAAPTTKVLRSLIGTSGDAVSISETR